MKVASELFKLLMDSLSRALDVKFFVVLTYLYVAKAAEWLIQTYAALGVALIVLYFLSGLVDRAKVKREATDTYL